MITRDEGKRAGNLAQHGIDFAQILSFAFDTALYDSDDREECGEGRETAIGWCAVRLWFLIFVRRGDDDEMPVISFRKTTKPEVRCYAEP